MNLEEVVISKNELIKKADKVATIYKQGTTIKTWDKYTGVLSGGYLYLFKNRKDTMAEAYFWVKKALITMVDENECGFRNAFRLKNKYIDCIFATDKPE